MKPLKISLRFWILITSIFSFLAGWGLFSHAGKPTPFSIFASQSTDTTTNDTTGTQSISGFSPIPTLQPIPSLDSLLSGTTSSNSGTGLSTGSFNVQRVQIPSTNSMPQLPTRRMHTNGS
jgi:hypothetical protein